MEIEITKPLPLNDHELARLDTHSFLNLLNVFYGELDFISMLLKTPLALPKTKAHLKRISGHLEDPAHQMKFAHEFKQLKLEFREELALLATRHPGMNEKPDMIESLENITSLTRVIGWRAAEYERRKQSPKVWEVPPIADVRKTIWEFLDAVQRNARGRYRIVLENEKKEADDYLVVLDIRSGSDPRIILPPIMQDVIRDLLANARKYTKPGGTIRVQLLQDDLKLCLSVSDNGYGIPESELDKVVDFGYRASNTRHIPTKGGGLGLTKAYWATKKLGGRFWIQSILEQGTQITIHIPLPADI